MVVLTTDAKSWWFRSMRLRQEFLNEVPAFENFAPANYAWGLAGWYVSLHTANPFAGSEAPGGGQGESEVDTATYPFLARVQVLRDGSHWEMVEGDPANPYVQNLLAVVWGKNTSGGNVGPITHLGIGRDGTGAGSLRYAMAFDSSVTIPNKGVLTIVRGGLRIYER